MNHEQTMFELANKYSVTAPFNKPALHVVIEMLDAIDKRADTLEQAITIMIRSVNTMTDAMAILTNELRGKPC